MASSTDQTRAGGPDESREYPSQKTESPKPIPNNTRAGGPDESRGDGVETPHPANDAKDRLRDGQ